MCEACKELDAKIEHYEAVRCEGRGFATARRCAAASVSSGSNRGRAARLGRLLGLEDPTLASALFAAAWIDPAAGLRLTGRRRARAVAGIAADFEAGRFRHASPAPRKAETGGVVRGRGRSIILDAIEGS